MDAFTYIFSSHISGTDVSVPTNEDCGNAGYGSGCMCIIAWDALLLIAYYYAFSIIIIVRLFLCIDENILLIMSSASSETHTPQHYRYHYDHYHAIFQHLQLAYYWYTWTTAAQILDFQLQIAITFIIRFTYYKVSSGQIVFYFLLVTELAIFQYTYV